MVHENKWDMAGGLTSALPLSPTQTLLSLVNMEEINKCFHVHPAMCLLTPRGTFIPGWQSLTAETQFSNLQNWWHDCLVWFLRPSAVRFSNGCNHCDLLGHLEARPGRKQYKLKSQGSDLQSAAVSASIQQICPSLLPSFFNWVIKRVLRRSLNAYLFGKPLVPHGHCILLTGSHNWPKQW